MSNDANCHHCGKSFDLTDGFYYCVKNTTLYYAPSCAKKMQFKCDECDGTLNYGEL